ncbi:hypothetical protein HD806DRAFT_548289 [Xylariaceae sp. AK1471]|nr:hypothetical protein HD806DRAFT_548289 [Xylariaceae sp. AK1471]
MCLLDVMCSKTKTKSKSSTKKTSKKQDCHECTTRKIARDEFYQIFSPMAPYPMALTQMHMMSRNQLGYDCGYGYGYADLSAWEDNYPAMVSGGQWKEHMQTAKNTYDASQEHGKMLVEVKGVITSEIKQAQKAIKETHDSVNTTESHVKDTREVVDLAYAGIKNTHAAVKEAQMAIKKTQDGIQENHAAHMGKHEECAADVKRVRQLLEEEAKKREEARRMQEMVQYAQSQGLLQTQAQAQAQDRDRDSRGQSSQSSSRTTSTSQWEHEREQFEKQQQVQQAQFAEAMRKFTDAQQRLREEQDRWLRQANEGEHERLGHRDSSYHHPRPEGMYYDDVIEVPPYNAYSYAEYGVGGGGGGSGTSAVLWTISNKLTAILIGLGGVGEAIEMCRLNDPNGPNEPPSRHRTVSAIWTLDCWWRWKSQLSTTLASYLAPWPHGRAARWKGVVDPHKPSPSCPANALQGPNWVGKREKRERGKRKKGCDPSPFSSHFLISSFQPLPRSSLHLPTLLSLAIASSYQLQIHTHFLLDFCAFAATLSKIKILETKAIIVVVASLIHSSESNTVETLSRTKANGTSHSFK